jgi:hypothetical protein
MWVAQAPAQSRVGACATADSLMTGGDAKEHCEMWFYVQMWFPLLTITLTAAICLTVVSFIMGQGKVHR